jgi:NADH dehydrogenase
VRNSGLDYTVIKAGVVYGRGDHMLDHLSHALHTLSLFALVGLKEKSVRPLAVEDLVHVMRCSFDRSAIETANHRAAWAQKRFI